MFYPGKFSIAGGSALYCAQRNLNDRTHYVDNDTLRFHKSRVLRSYVVDDGLLFAIIESIATDYNNKKRGFRYVVFNIFGEVISRVDLEHCWSTRSKATAEMWRYLNAVDALEITKVRLGQVQQQTNQYFNDLRASLIKQAA